MLVCRPRFVEPNVSVRSRVVSDLHGSFVETFWQVAVRAGPTTDEEPGIAERLYGITR